MLGLAATAFAVHAEIPSETQSVVAKGETQITLGGSIRVRGEMRKNTSDFDSDLDDSDGWYDERVRLTLDATLGSVKGYIATEIGTGKTDDTYKWGTGGDGAGGVYTEGNSKRGDYSLLEGWMLYDPGMVGVKIGHMPLALGNKLFFDHSKFGDDAIVIFADPSKMLHVGLLAIKFTEGGTAGASDDTDGYVGLATVKTDMFNAGIDIVYLKDQNFGTDELKFWNYGLRADVKAGPVSIKADVEIQDGEYEAGANSIGGEAYLVGASAKLGPVNAGLEVGYGSGDDPSSANDNEIFVTSLSTGIPYIGFVYNVRAKGAAGMTASGVANTTYGKVSVNGSAGAMGYGVDLLYLMASEELEDKNAAGGDNDGVCEAGETCTDDIGFEVDAKVSYKLAKNLTYWIEGGYLVAGDVYNSAAKTADDAYALRHGIELSF